MGQPPAAGGARLQSRVFTERGRLARIGAPAPTFRGSPSAYAAGEFGRDARAPGASLEYTPSDYSAAIRGAAASSAADRRGGDIGRSVMRTPVARAMALPTAASGGTIGTSPTPRTP